MDNKIIVRRTSLVKVLSNLEVLYIAKVQGAWVSLDQDFLLKKERRREGLMASWFPGLNNSRTARTSVNWTISNEVHFLL